MVEVKAYEKIVGLGFSIGQPLLEDRKRKNRWEFTNYTDQQISPETSDKAALASEKHD